MMFSPWIKTGTSPEEFKRMNHGSLCSLSGRFTSCSSHFRAFSAIAKRTCNGITGVTPGEALPGQLSPVCGAGPVGPRLPGPALPRVQATRAAGTAPPCTRRHPGRRQFGACRPPPLAPAAPLTFCEEKDCVQWYSTSGAMPGGAERHGTARCAAPGGAGGLSGRAAAAVPTPRRPALGNQKKGVPGGGRGVRGPPASFPRACPRTARRTAFPTGKPPAKQRTASPREAQEDGCAGKKVTWQDFPYLFFLYPFFFFP